MTADSEAMDICAIQRLLARYARGIDRMDRNLLESTYWPDGIDNHPGYRGTRDDFIDHTMVLLEKHWDRTTHFLGQSLIEVDGASACAETYFYATHIRKGEKSDRFETWSGRYVDRLERRSGEWRIAERHVIIDWNNIAPFNESKDPRIPLGRRDREDKSYAIMARELA